MEFNLTCTEVFDDGENTCQVKFSSSGLPSGNLVLYFATGQNPGYVETQTYTFSGVAKA